MPSVTLVTVRHTGSHFALRLLGQRYRRHSLTEDPVGDPLWFSHAETENLPMIREKCEYGPLVLTMRNAMNVARSWMKRGKEMDHVFRSMWKNLFMLKEQYKDSYWLPIDTHDREERLNAISERLGYEFISDWVPLGTFYGASEYKEGMTLEDAQRFFRSLPFDEFGYVI